METLDGVAQITGTRAIYSAHIVGAGPHKALAIVLLGVRDVTAAADDPLFTVHCNSYGNDVEISVFKLLSLIRI